MKLSVIVITYNHLRFIRQCLDSVLRQQTDFDFEILIVEDCSTDGTREMVIEYANRFPDKIRLLLSPQNINDNTILMNAFQAARGEYLTILDGDDYWLSTGKLQKQADYMDRHPEYVFSWHPAEFVDDEGKWLKTLRRPMTPAAWTIQDYFDHYPDPATGSVMIRKSALKIPDWYASCTVGDYPLWFILLQEGPAGYMDEVLSAYRYHSGGWWSGRDEVARRENTLVCNQELYRNLDSRYRPILRRIVAGSWWSLAGWQLRCGQKEASRSSARKGLKECPGVLQLLILAYAPWVWMPLRDAYRFARRMTGRSVTPGAGLT